MTSDGSVDFDFVASTMNTGTPDDRHVRKSVYTRVTAARTDRRTTNVVIDVETLRDHRFLIATQCLEFHGHITRRVTVLKRTILYVKKKGTQ